MTNHQRFRRESRRAALCGMMAALSVLILSLGSFIPLMTFLVPVLAMLCLTPVTARFGTGAALLVYGAVSLLSLPLCPDLEAALLYVFLGWYPAVRGRLTALPRPLRPVVKCVLFTAAVLAMYALILRVFRLEAVSSEFAGYSRGLRAALLLLGNAAFLLLDQVLARWEARYRRS